LISSALESGTLRLNAVKIGFEDFSRFVATPCVPTNQFERDGPAAADMAAGENFFQAGQAKLSGGDFLNVVTVVKCVVGVQSGKQEQQRVPAAKKFGGG
jgi:hypothetical protein